MRIDRFIMLISADYQFLQLAPKYSETSRRILLMCVSYCITTTITVAVFGIAYLLWRSPELLQQL